MFNGTHESQKVLKSLERYFGSLKTKPRLALISVGSDAAGRSFILQKKKTAGKIGVDFRIYDFPKSISENLLVKNIKKISADRRIKGVIVQLPLPEKINTQNVLDTVPANKDIDVLSSSAFGAFALGKSKILPSVVGAIEHFLKSREIKVKGKNAVVVGKGRLVGLPSAIWLANQGATVSVIDEHTPPKVKNSLLKKADIIVSGVGKPKIIKGNNVKKGVIVFDAGISRIPGRNRKKVLIGDVDFQSVSKKTKFMTPVPGGIGPLAVAMIFKNLKKLLF